MNYLIDSKTAMSEAFAQATGKPTNVFEFNLVDRVNELKSVDFKVQLLSTIAFACDAFINNTLKATLNDYKKSHDADADAPWDTYQTFLNYAAGLATSQQSMIDAGMLVKDTAHRLQTLFNMRCHLHALCTAAVGESYEVPSLEEFILNPRLQKYDLDSQAKAEINAKELATDDDGVLNMDVYITRLEIAHKRATAEAIEALKWDKERARVTVLLLRAYNLRDDKADAVESEYGTFDPFGNLDHETQYKLLHGTIRYAEGIFARAEKPRSKVTVNELTMWNVEWRPLRKAILQAVEHPVFADIS